MGDTCQLCPYRSRPVLGQGPAPCRVLFVGEGPGRQEHAKGIPFCGESGWELDGLYLPLAGLSRAQVHVTNVMKCRQGDDNPTDAQAAYCARHHFAGEMARVQSEVIVTLGAVAARILFPDCDLSLDHGLPRQAGLSPEIAVWSGLHVPMYHPAAGIRDSHWMVELAEDFRRLKKILNQGWAGPVDQRPEPRYYVADQPFYPDDLEPGEVVAIDTEVESLETMKPWCLSLSWTEGQGLTVMADNRQALTEIARWIGDPRWAARWARAPIRVLVALHSALLVDLPVLAGMGIRIPERRLVDTAAMAYHQGVPPWGLGLKTLARRLCGMRMVDFDELVRPGSLAVLWDFLQVCDRKIGRGPIRRRLNRLISDLAAGRAQDPWKRIREWETGDRLELERAAGAPLPRPSIVHVPRAQALKYAARDADATLRVYHALRSQAGDRLRTLNWGGRSREQPRGAAAQQRGSTIIPAYSEG